MRPNESWVRGRELAGEGAKGLDGFEPTGGRDVADDEKLRLLAQAASSEKSLCTTADFRDRYQYLTTDFHGAI